MTHREGDLLAALVFAEDKIEAPLVVARMNTSTWERVVKAVQGASSFSVLGHDIEFDESIPDNCVEFVGTVRASW